MILQMTTLSSQFSRRDLVRKTLNLIGRHTCCMKPRLFVSACACQASFRHWLILATVQLLCSIYAVLCNVNLSYVLDAHLAVQVTADVRRSDQHSPVLFLARTLVAFDHLCSFPCWKACMDFVSGDRRPTDDLTWRHLPRIRVAYMPPSATCPPKSDLSTTPSHFCPRLRELGWNRGLLHAQRSGNTASCSGQLGVTTLLCPSLLSEAAAD